MKRKARKWKMWAIMDGRWPSDLYCKEDDANRFKDIDKIIEVQIREILPKRRKK